MRRRMHGASEWRAARYTRRGRGKALAVGLPVAHIGRMPKLPVALRIPRLASVARSMVVAPVALATVARRVHTPLHGSGAGPTSGEGSGGLRSDAEKGTGTNPRRTW